MTELKVRIAPSPSGYLHVGTARTALFNWLFARAGGGKFVIRIEDTDAERTDADLVQPILDALAWLGMESDEDIVYQSQRQDSHRSFVNTLLESDCAYRCFCSKERLEKVREENRAKKLPPRYDRHCAGLSSAQIQEQLELGTPFVVRIKIPAGETTYHDLVLGDITRANTEIEDFVVARADGSALYNFAVVVDDHEMQITQVIRGNDHITNTFKQIHIYRALNWDPPEFGHVPLLLRPDKKKISKRLGDKDVAEYGAEGILPQAMFNFLCLLGWSPKDGREIMTRDEIIQAFSVAGINANNPVFDEQKLLAFNKEHLKSADIQQLYDLIAPDLVSAGVIDRDWLKETANQDFVKSTIDLMRERLRVTKDFAQLAAYFFTDNFEYDEKGVARQFTPDSAGRLDTLADRFEALESFDKDSLEQALDALATEQDIKRAALIHPARLAVSGMTMGPGLYDLLVTIGQERTVERLRRAVAFVRELKHDPVTE